MGAQSMPHGRSRFHQFLRHPLLVALVAALVAGAFTLAAAAIGSRAGSTLGGVLAPPATDVTTATATATVTITATTTATATITPMPSSSPQPTEIPAGKPNPLLLADISPDQFVERSFGARAGAVTIDGKDYPNAYSYTFSNCSTCTYVDVIKVDRTYTRLTGSFGLTDDTAHNETIDGVVYASIYANDKLIYGPKRVEYPAVVRFDLELNASRITLKVGNGTNVETAAWADVKLQY